MQIAVDDRAGVDMTYANYESTFGRHFGRHFGSQFGIRIV